MGGLPLRVRTVESAQAYHRAHDGASRAARQVAPREASCGCGTLGLPGGALLDDR